MTTKFHYSTAFSGGVESKHIMAQSSNFMREQQNQKSFDDEDSDYMDMTPKRTPSHDRKIANLSRSPKIYPHTKNANVSPYRKNLFNDDDNDYTDMSGNLGSKLHNLSPSANQISRSKGSREGGSFVGSSANGLRGDRMVSSTRTKLSRYPSKSNDDFVSVLSSSSNPYPNDGAFSKSKPKNVQTSLYQNEPRSLKPDFSFGQENDYQKIDEDDDYADVEEIKIINQNSARKLHQARVPAKNSAVIQPPSSPPSQPHRRVAENYVGHAPEQVVRKRSGGMLVTPGHLSSTKDYLTKHDSAKPAEEKKSPPKSSKAGKAAWKYLQTKAIVEKDPNLYEIKRTASVGVVNSPRAGVQSRIHRSRQSLSRGKNSSKSEEHLSSKPQQSKNADLLVNENVIDMEEFVSKRNNPAAPQNKEVEVLDSDSQIVSGPKQSFHKISKQGCDAAQMMKFIAEGTKSRSLDKNYVEWLVKTSPFASRTSSVSSTSGSKHHSTSDINHTASLGKMIINIDDICEEDEAFESYVAGISRHQKEKKSSKKSSFWNRSKKNKSKSVDNLKNSANEPPSPPPTITERKKSRKSVKNKSKKLKDAAKKPETTVLIDQDNPKSSAIKEFKEGVMKTNSDYEVTGKPPSSPSAYKIHDESGKSSVDRSRASSAKSLKKKQNIPNKLERGSTATHIEVNEYNKSHKRNHSETLKRISEQLSQSHSNHKRNNSDFLLNHPKSEGLSTASDLPSSLLDISLASNYDDDPDSFPHPTKQKNHTTKSNTIGRIFGRKTKHRKSLDSESLWGEDADDLDLEKFRSLCVNSVNDHVSSENKSKPSASKYMRKSYLVHGFAFPHPKHDTAEEKDDSFFSRWSGKKARTLGPRNKYATITGFSSMRRSLPKTKTDSENTLKDVKRADYRSRRSVYLFSEKTPTETHDVISYSENHEEKNSSDSDDYMDMESWNHLNQEVKIHTMRDKIFPISQIKNERTLEIAAILLHCINFTQPEILSSYKDVDSDTEDDSYINANEKRLDQDEFVPASYVKGCDLVTWLLNLFQAKQKYDEKEDSSLNNFIIPIPPTRKQLTGMWQILLEEGAICHVRFEEHFEDVDLTYGFHADVTSPSQLPEKFAKLDGDSHIKNGEKVTDAMLRLMPVWAEELDMADILAHLKKNSHDAIFRKALRKQSRGRTLSELKMIYEEVVHFNSIRHLSDTVKRELARVLKFESHSEEGKVLFRQGDEAACWYIILKGSVNVEVTGKGTVCSLQEGDDFGSLALMNDARRSATIILAEPEVHLIRVDKSDYFRILKNIEENTLRLQEHGKDVLVLEKTSAADYGNNNNGPIDFQPTPRKSKPHSYSVTAGTPARILEHILEYLLPWQISPYDETLENFILMYSTFMKGEDLFKILLNRYRSEDSGSVPFDRSNKRKIVYFVVRWSHIITYLRSEDEAAEGFLQELADEVKYDSIEFPEYSQLKDEFAHLYRLDESSGKKGRILLIEENVRKYQPGMDQVELLKPLRSFDQTLIKVYNSEQTYATVKVPLCGTAEEVVIAATEKLFSTNHEDVILVESMECGDRIELPKDQRSVATTISLNSSLCVCEERDSIDMKKVPKSVNSSQKFHLDDVSSLEVAYHVTQYDWHLFNNVHVLEYVFKVFGTRKFQRVTPNLDILTRRFNQLAYWPPSEILSCSNANKRALVLRKFIKIAQHLKRFRNMNAFMAVMIGIGNQAVSRLYSTWEKLPNRYKKMVQEFEAILDPSRNHHSYRIFASSMDPPYLPYFPLLMKDMTFQHEGNEDQKQELVNFEKMHMISSSIRSILGGCSSKFEDEHTIASTKTTDESKKYVQSMQVITDQRVLNEMSAQLEPKR